MDALRAKFGRFWLPFKSYLERSGVQLEDMDTDTDWDLLLSEVHWEPKCEPNVSQRAVLKKALKFFFRPPTHVPNQSGTGSYQQIVGPGPIHMNPSRAIESKYESSLTKPSLAAKHEEAKLSFSSPLDDFAMSLLDEGPSQPLAITNKPSAGPASGQHKSVPSHNTVVKAQKSAPPKSAPKQITTGFQYKEPVVVEPASNGPPGHYKSAPVQRASAHTITYTGCIDPVEASLDRECMGEYAAVHRPYAKAAASTSYNTAHTQPKKSRSRASSRLHSALEAQADQMILAAAPVVSSDITKRKITKSAVAKRVVNENDKPLSNLDKHFQTGTKTVPKSAFSGKIVQPPKSPLEKTVDTSADVSGFDLNSMADSLLDLLPDDNTPAKSAPPVPEPRDEGPGRRKKRIAIGSWVPSQNTKEPKEIEEEREKLRAKAAAKERKEAAEAAEKSHSNINLDRAAPRHKSIPSKSAFTRKAPAPLNDMRTPTKEKESNVDDDLLTECMAEYGAAYAPQKSPFYKAVAEQPVKRSMKASGPAGRGIKAAPKQGGETAAAASKITKQDLMAMNDEIHEFVHVDGPSVQQYWLEQWKAAGRPDGTSHLNNALEAARAMGPTHSEGYEDSWALNNVLATYHQTDSNLLHNMIADSVSAKVDTNNDEVLELQEFKDLMLKTRGVAVTDEQVQEAFNKADKDHNGDVSFGELIKWLDQASQNQPKHVLTGAI